MQVTYLMNRMKRIAHAEIIMAGVLVGRTSSKASMSKRQRKNCQFLTVQTNYLNARNVSICGFDGT